MSSEPSVGQVPVNGTIQVNVAPGDQTGLYYIILANLPWSTSWQQLKDHVRAVCHVERVEVFNESTTGWVCVRGRENYEAALKLLSGGVFNGRPTFADGRNATQSIWIKELVSSFAASSSTQSSRVPRCAGLPSAASYAQGTPLIMSPAGSSIQWTSLPNSLSSAPTSGNVPTDYGSPSVSASPSYDYSGSPNWHQYHAGTREYSPHAISTQCSPQQYNYEALLPVPPQYPTHEEHQGSSYSAGTQRSARGPKGGRAGGDGYVSTEKRKIIIRGLPASTLYPEVRELVQSKAGPEANTVLHVSMPTTATKEGNRGYATVTFMSEDVANRAIRRLHGHKFNGRILKVELTKEGVSRSEGPSRAARSTASQQHSGKGHREEKSKTDKKEPADKKTLQVKKDVVIANGSSQKASEKICLRLK